ncbi:MULTISPECIES: serine hydrolase domain-containing protein [unclassified Streptomyces]|uniref:serine hydrolase domain-containing protein n=1 Tax=unclassified Streptomyces TaxID=2593676 RepID=UPI0007EE1393|nr:MULTISPECIES: serine hydrolase domain-containing protein [unclassified Streptomyces]MCP3770867.1 beta-lactamase family protein [Streptomyces sp. MAR25Y5]OBQ49192.1 hydrolase [Streptomyces sp. H-KF8]
MRINRLVGIALGTALFMTTAAPMASADTETVSSTAESLDRAALRTTLGAVHDAGMYGGYSSVREGAERWTGASGLADVDTGRPVKPGMRHRVGSISKTFTAVAVLQQVERGRIRLDAPVGEYLPGLIKGERGRDVTVRMLLNHTSGIGDYFLGAFPSLADDSTASLDEGRFRSVRPEELVRLGLAAPATGRPGEQPGSYSNTNYVIAGLLLEKVTGQSAGTYITRNVIDRAGLHATSYPRTPSIKGPHSRMYESFYGLIDPPRDYSVYDMSWASAAGSIVSTTDDLNRFYRTLLTGGLIGPAALGEMLRTVPVIAGGFGVDYGLGIYVLDLPGCGRFWGHDGAVFGAGTIALSSRDGKRQLAMGWNLMKYQRLNEDGTALEPSVIDHAINEHIAQALCRVPESREAAAGARQPLPEGLPGVDLSSGRWVTPG